MEIISEKRIDECKRYTKTIVNTALDANIEEYEKGFPMRKFSISRGKSNYCTVIRCDEFNNKFTLIAGCEGIYLTQYLSPMGKSLCVADHLPIYIWDDNTDFDALNKFLPTVIKHIFNGTIGIAGDENLIFS